MPDDPTTTPADTPAPSSSTEGTPPVTPAPVEPGPSGGTDWRAALPEDQRALKSIEPFKDIAALVKGYDNLSRKLGTASDERPPDSPDGYKLKLPEFGPDTGLAWDQARMAKPIAALHAAGLTTKQMQAAVDVYAGLVVESHDQQRSAWGKQEAEALAAGTAALERRWGPKDGPTWKAREGRVHAVINGLAADGATADEINGMLAMAVKYPVLLEGMARWGDQMLERGFIDGADVPQGMTMDEAERKADEIRARMKTLPEGDPVRLKLRDDLLELNRIAAGPRGREVVATVGR